MNNKTKEFNVITVDGTSTAYTLNFNPENPTIEFNGNTYNACMPGEVLKHEKIKNPQPLPKNTYGFIIEDELFIVAKTHLHGLYIQSLNPKLAVTYKGKNLFDNIVKYSLIVIAITVVLLVAFMGWDY